MGRNLSLLRRLPVFEEDGVTHRRDCSCARCDAGFAPTGQERAEAQRRWEQRKAREAAARALARKRERDRLRRAEAESLIDLEVQRADGQLRELRDLDARLGRDRRLEELWRLRRKGLSLAASMEEIDRRFGPAEEPPTSGATNQAQAWAQQGSNLRPTD